MIIECMPLENKIAACNRLGELARTYIADGDFSRPAQVKFYRSVIKLSMKNLDTSPTLDLDTRLVLEDVGDREPIILAESPYAKLSPKSPYPVLVDNIMFRTVEHAVYYYRSNQDYNFLARLLAEDNPKHFGLLFERTNQSESFGQIDVEIQNNILSSLLRLRVEQNDELRELLSQFPKSFYVCERDSLGYTDDRTLGCIYATLAKEF